MLTLCPEVHLFVWPCKNYSCSITIHWELCGHYLTCCVGAFTNAFTLATVMFDSNKCLLEIWWWRIWELVPQTLVVAMVFWEGHVWKHWLSEQGYDKPWFSFVIFRVYLSSSMLTSIRGCLAYYKEDYAVYRDKESKHYKLVIFASAFVGCSFKFANQVLMLAIIYVHTMESGDFNGVAIFFHNW